MPSPLVVEYQLIRTGNQPIYTNSLANTNVVSVSPYGIANGTSLIVNGGAQFGCDTPGTKSYGFTEAYTFAATLAGGATIEVWAGPFTWSSGSTVLTWASTYCLFAGGSNITWSVSTAAVFTMPLDPSLFWTINVGTNQRNPLMVLSGTTNFHWSGGQFTQAAGTPVQRDPCFLVADSNAYTEIDHMYATATNYFPILLSGNYTDNAIGVAHSGAYSFFKEHDNQFINCGTHGGVYNDGGGVRTSNTTSPSVVCHHISLGLNTVIQLTTGTTGLFGYDFTNPSAANAGQITDITIFNPYIIGALASGSNQILGINIEANQSANLCSDMTIIDPHITGCYRGMQMSGGWQRIKVLGGIYENSYQQGIQCVTANSALYCVLNDVQFVAPNCLNNNQQGNAAARFAGLLIGFDGQNSVAGSGGNGLLAGTMMNISVLGGSYSDFQATPTQNYGVSILNVNNSNLAGGALYNVYVTGGTTFGNVKGGVNVGIGGNLTNTNVTFGLVVSSVIGYNPVALIATPFQTVANIFMSVYGNSAIPIKNVDYTWMIPNGTLALTGGTGVAVTVTGPDGTVILNAATTPIAATAIPIGSDVNFGNFSVAPATMTITSNGTAITGPNVFLLGPNGAHTTFGCGITGGTATLGASQRMYRVLGTGIYLTVSGGTVQAIHIYDPNGTDFGSIGTSTTGFFVAPGFLFQIQQTGAPTVSIFGA